MISHTHNDADNAQQYLEQLESRYQRTQEALTSARANFQAMRELTGSSERQVRQAMHRVQQLKAQLAALEDAMERVEERDGEETAPRTRPANRQVEPSSGLGAHPRD
jgi:predicted  nucleic acid-binding Zn-ribbon protein